MVRARKRRRDSYHSHRRPPSECLTPFRRLMVIGQTLINHRRPTPDMVGGCLQRRQKPNSRRNDHKVGADVFGPRARACKAIAISAEPPSWACSMVPEAAALFAAQHCWKDRPPRPRDPPALHQGDHTSPRRRAPRRSSSVDRPANPAISRSSLARSRFRGRSFSAIVGGETRGRLARVLVSRSVVEWGFHRFAGSAMR